MSDESAERFDQPESARDDDVRYTAGGEPAAQTVPVNMYQAEEALVVVAPLPGVMPDDVEVSVEGGRLTLRAAMRTAAPKDYLLHEWHYGPYERTLDLPDEFRGEATARFGNGQLALRIARGKGAAGRQVVKPSG